MQSRIRLVLATYNVGKLKELTELLRGLPAELVDLGSFPEVPPLNEYGKTFGENALIKARAIAQFTGELTLADDSGLEVDFLGGCPGVISSQYAGPNASDRENNLKLLEELEGVPEEKRGATFKCTLALASPKGEEDTVEGECRGRIGFERKGEGGFGYDPIFVWETGKTLAELPLEIKNRVSHRARAAEKLKKILPKFLALASDD